MKQDSTCAKRKTDKVFSIQRNSFSICIILTLLCSAPMVLFSQIPAYLPADGLVGWWPFNGNANDESGNGNHGTVNGATLTADRNGNSQSSYTMNGISNFINLGGNSYFNSSNISVGVWIYPVSFAGGKYIIHKSTDFGNDRYWGIRTDNQGILSIEGRINGIYFDYYEQDISLVTNQWNFICFSYDGVNVRLTVNNNLVIDQYNVGTLTDNGYPVITGYFPDEQIPPHGYFFNGQIDDIAIYNRALTPLEITALYNGTTDVSGCTNATACNYNASATLDDGTCTFPTQTYLNCDGTCINDTDADGICNELETPTLPDYLPTNGLVGYWPFNGNANDESGNGNHGTVYGATLTADRNGNPASSYGFNSFSQVINLPELSSTFGTPTSLYSCSFWFKLSNDLPLGVDGVMFHSSTENHENIFSRIGIVYGNKLKIYHRNNLENNEPTSLQSLASNTWHNVTITINHVIGSYRLFLNGLELSEMSFNFNPNYNYYTPSRTWQIGGISAAASYHYFIGEIDDLAVYNRALTQEEITALYTGSSSNNNGGGGTAGTPVASVPAGIPYQAVIRDNAGAALVNTAVSVRFTLHQNTTDGTVEYQETHDLTTSALGLINTHFGSGTATQGTFANINWSNTTKFIQVEVNTGNGFVDIGTQQLMSVPFAFQANKAAAIKNAGLPVYADNAAALAGGLVAGEMYRTAAGILMVVY